jgi:hypothetical protein
MKELSLNQYLSLISSIYFLSDTQNSGGIPEYFFQETNEYLNIPSPKGIKQWMKENTRSKGFYEIPKIEEDVDIFVQQYLNLKKQPKPLEPIIIQCNKAIRYNNEIKFTDGTSKKIDKRTLKELYSILTDEYIKPENRFELQNYVSENYNNLLKVVELNREMMKGEK